MNQPPLLAFQIKSVVFFYLWISFQHARQIQLDLNKIHEANHYSDTFFKKR